MAKTPHVSEAEWQVMKIIWRQPGCTAQQVIECLPAGTNWTAATVKTLLNRLHRKGAIRFEKNGKAYFYFAKHPEEAFQAAESSSFIDRVFDGGLSPMFAHFIQSRRISRKELAELEQMLRDVKEGK